MYNQLCEVLDITQQIAEAMGRQDQVTLRMLIAMRQEPIDQLREIQANQTDERAAMSEDVAARILALLQGEAAANAEEEPLAQQIASNRRLLSRIMELDRRVNTRFGGDASFYAGEDAQRAP